ncbi:MAG: prepilin-type N-terminal cleavage/methylation domain-containing protein [Gemmatimonadetes bacterium]|nr:prepilin-type N-terminal cleavage/methylation domain-containing protein [Gemmatimonadota bacterium]
MRQAGYTLVELLIGLVLLSTIFALGWSGLRRARDAAALEGAARSVMRQLTLGRNIAVARREPVRLRAGPTDLALYAADGSRLSALDIGPGGELPVDSVDVRPSTIRFNARGHAGAGSIYLWKGRRGIRLVCNFLGRVRRETVSAP